MTRPALPPPFVIFSQLWRLLLYFFSHRVRLSWFHRKSREHSNQSKFSESSQVVCLFVDYFLFSPEIIADEDLTRKIELIEDALGNEVYYFFLKTDRKAADYPIDFDDDRV